MKKLSIIGGAGGLGSTMGFYLGLKGLFREITLIDVKENVLKSHVMDMSQCLSELARTDITAGTWKDLAGSDMVIMAASIPALKVASRNEFLEANMRIVRAAAEEIGKYCSAETVVLTATAPIDVYNYMFWKILGGARKRFVGFCRNDSLRLRWAAGKILGIPETERIGGWVVGEHGETQVPLYGTVTVDGKAADLTPDQTARMDKAIKTWFSQFQALDSGRTTNWTSTTSITRVVAAIAAETGEPQPGSAILNGEYGISDVSVGLPLRFSLAGWDSALELSLSAAEQAALLASARHIRSLIDQCL